MKTFNADKRLRNQLARTSRKRATPEYKDGSGEYEYQLIRAFLRLIQGVPAFSTIILHARYSTTIAMEVEVDEKVPSPLLSSAIDDPDRHLTKLGYTAELRRNRSLFTLLFQTLAIAAIPYGEGGPLISAIYGGGPLSIF